MYPINDYISKNKGLGEVISWGNGADAGFDFFFSPFISDTLQQLIISFPVCFKIIATLPGLK